MKRTVTCLRPINQSTLLILLFVCGSTKNTINSTTKSADQNRQQSMYYFCTVYCRFSVQQLLPHAATHSANYAVTRCLSVTRRQCAKMTKRIIILFSPSGSHIIFIARHPVSESEESKFR